MRLVDAKDLDPMTTASNLNSEPEIVRLVHVIPNSTRYERKLAEYSKRYPSSDIQSQAILPHRQVNQLATSAKRADISCLNSQEELRTLH
jgi:hypothetical protein